MYLRILYENDELLCTIVASINHSRPETKQENNMRTPNLTTTTIYILTI